MKIPETGRRQLAHAVRKLTREGVLVKVKMGRYVHPTRVPAGK
jgi:predicted transcriptional regulator of viral defense system